MLMGPPVLEMSQKAGLDPVAWMSRLVPAKLAAGEQRRMRADAMAVLVFMASQEWNASVEDITVLLATNRSGQG